MIFLTNSQEETIEFGKKIAKKLQGGDIVLLYGDLGAGKTTLVKGIASGLGIKEEIISPTFTLLNVYNCLNKNLVHIDTYRLNNEQGLIDIGTQDYLGEKNTICIIEWPEKITNLLKNKKTISIKIKNVEENVREIEVE